MRRINVIKMKKILLMAIVVLVMATSAYAANLLTNPGFETGDFTGWTVTEIGGWASGGVAGIPGDFYVVMYPYGIVPGDGYFSISQTLTTVPGTKYNLDYDLSLVSNQGTIAFQVFWGGVVVPQADLTTLIGDYWANVHNPTRFGVPQPSIEVTASGASTTIEFKVQGYNGDNEVHLRGPSVEAQSNGGPVPEPSTILMSIFGVLPVVFRWMKRRFL